MIKIKSKLPQVFKSIISRWKNDHVTKESAAVSFYAVLALPSLLLSMVAFASLFFDSTTVRQEFEQKAATLLGSGETELVTKIITAIPASERYGVPAFIGIFILFFSASKLFSSLKAGLNRIWNVTPKTYHGIDKIKRRLIQQLLLVLLAIILSVLFLFAIVTDILVVTQAEALQMLLPISINLVQLVSFGISFFLLYLVFVAIYTILPDAKTAQKDIWVGAFITTILITIGKFFVGLYIQQINLGSAYGAAGSVIILLVSIYYGSIILFFGAECTQVYASKYGSMILPNKHANSTFSLMMRVKHYFQDRF
jgi:membrane protein